MKKMIKGMWVTYICILILMLTGCGKQSEEFIPIVKEEYEKQYNETVQVQKGTIEPVLEISLKPDEYEIISYNITMDMLEIEEMKVEVGDRVNEGDVMVLFKNDGLTEKITEYERRLEEDQLMIEHYKKMNSISESDDNQKQIESLESDIKVVNAYIEETKAQLADYQLVAKRAGVVNFVADELKSGYGVGGKKMVGVISGSSNYTAVTNDDYKFEIGQEFEAEEGMGKYTLKLIEIEEKGDSKTLLFEPVSEMTGIDETASLTLVIKKNTIANVLFVEENAVFSNEETSYVFVVDDEGFKHPKDVKIDSCVEGYAIIKEGVSEGEWVSLK